MSDEIESTETAAAPEPAATEAPKAESNDLPEWARKQLAQANKEAANYRVQLRAEQEARKASDEQVVDLTSKYTEAATAASTVQVDFDKLVTAVQALVPDKPIFTFANTLKGETAEALASHAAELKEMFGLPIAPSPAVDRSQGLGGGGTSTDPASEFAALLQSSLKR